MNPSDGNAPSWLFAFVDLAFLLLLGTTQLASTATVDLGELPVPHIGSDERPALAPGSDKRWQVRVHPSDTALSESPDASPFELVDSEGNASRLPLARLTARLAELASADTRRPLLAPHPDARSEDLLQAVALLQAHWSDRSRATVRWDAPR